MTELKTGDRVSAVPSFSMEDYSTYGEVAVLPVSALTKYPDNLSSVQGTSIWMQYLTAYGLIEFGKMREGHHVLITAAASSVGLAAIELANSVGAIPIATTRNVEKKLPCWRPAPNSSSTRSSRDGLTKYGKSRAALGLTWPATRWPGPNWSALLQTMRSEGMIFVYGALSPEPTPFPLFAAIGKGLFIRGYTLFSIITNPEFRGTRKVGFRPGSPKAN